MISRSISSPAVRVEWLSTMPPREMTATSGVPPPVSPTMQPGGSMIRRAGAQRGGHRLFDQVGLAGAGVEGGVVDGALLDLGDTARDADYDARPRDAEAVALVHGADEVVQHALRDVEVGDDAVFQRTHGNDVRRR